MTAGGEPLTPAGLLSAFGPRTPAAQSAVPALYVALNDALDHGGAAAVERAFASWQAVFAATTGSGAARRDARGARAWQALARGLGMETAACEPLRLLFAVHTYFALVARLLTARALAPSEPTRDTSPDDCFAWCAADPTLAVAAAVQLLAEQVQRFDPAAQPERPRGDVLKALYQRLLPRAIRHALGEYYTPDWLAEHCLDAAGYQGQRELRLLDPCCGSGTFLALAIGRLRRECLRCGLGPRETLETILRCISGSDLSPLAVLAARANYLLALGDLLAHLPPDVEIPVVQADAILPGENAHRTDGWLPFGSQDGATVAETQNVGWALPTMTQHMTVGDAHPTFHAPASFDLVVGNPPWIGWESLPADYRRQTQPLWVRYGLFPQRGMAAILGGGRKDLAMLVCYAATDRWLKPGGRLAMVITQAVFKMAAAGQGFRRFRCGDQPLGVQRVDDLAELRPFGDANTRTSVLVWTKGRPTEYPVPYVVWRAAGRRSFGEDATLDEVRAATRQLPLVAAPADPRNAASPWFTARPGVREALCPLLGKSDCTAHEGVNTGGANGVFWIEIAGRSDDGTLHIRNLVEGTKRAVPALTAAIEPDLVYPLLRGGDMVRWRAAPAAAIILAQDPATRRGIAEETMRRQQPKTYEYLCRFEAALRSRAALRRYFTRSRGAQTSESGPFYSMFDVGPYTLAPWKAVWHRMRAPLRAAAVGPVAGRPVLPQETLAFVACDSADEAHYLAALLNSAPLNLAAMSYSQAGGKSFGSPHLLEHLRLPAFDRRQPSHVELARLSAARHAAAASSAATVQEGLPSPATMLGMVPGRGAGGEGGPPYTSGLFSDGCLTPQAETAELDAAINVAASAVWAITPDTLAAMSRSLQEVTAARAP